MYDSGNDYDDGYNQGFDTATTQATIALFDKFVRGFTLDELDILKDVIQIVKEKLELTTAQNEADANAIERENIQNDYREGFTSMVEAAKKLMRLSSKIYAIKLVREATGMSLKDSKEFVENLDLTS